MKETSGRVYTIKRGRTFSAAAPGVQKEESLFSNHSFQQLSFALISSKEKKE
jgi:hypothetical protein